MKKKLIMCRSILCCTLLITAAGTAFARSLGDNPNVILAGVHYNTNAQVEKTEVKRTETYTGLDDKNENLNRNSSDSFQGLMMSPSVIMKVFAENPSIVSN